MRKSSLLAIFLFCSVAYGQGISNPGARVSGSVATNDCIKSLDGSPYNLASAGSACGSGGGAIISDTHQNLWTTAIPSGLNPGTCDPETEVAGCNNTGVSAGTLLAITTGNANVALGFGSFKSLTTAFGNVGLGEFTGENLTTGVNNMLMGAWAGRAMTTAEGNVAIGDEASRNMTSGAFNTCIGGLACHAVTTSSNAVAIGYHALENVTAADNTAVGFTAGFNLTTGVRNTLIGEQTGTMLTTGTDNAVLGYQAMENATAGVTGDIAIGSSALLVDADSNNTAIGRNALIAHTTGFSNIAINLDALEDHVSGSRNIGIGTFVGHAFGSHGVPLTSGDDNVWIGGGADTSAMSGSVSNTICIGSNCLVDASNHGVFDGGVTDFYFGTIGGSLAAIHVGSATVAGSTTLSGITSDATHTDASVCEDTTTHVLYSGSGTLGICLGTSSERFKHDIKPLSESCDAIRKLQPVSYRYNSGDESVKYGFTAERTLSAVPDIVALGQDKQPNSVDYLAIIPILVNCLQERLK